MKERLLFAKIESDRVLKIKNFDESKTPDIDNLSGIFLKGGASLIATPITQLCNLSFSYSRFPDTCKIAKPKQLFKEGSKADLKNYRPISPLPLMPKLMSKLSNTQWVRRELVRESYGFESLMRLKACLNSFTGKADI